MAKIGVQIAIIQDYPADLITPQTNAQIFNQALGDTLPVFLVSYESTATIDYSINQYIRLTTQLS
jgi:hypothetical protein